MAYLTGVKLRNFTIFKGDFSLEFPDGPGLHVFTGPNAMGKTHLLQVLYAAISLARPRVEDATPLSPYAFAEKLIDVFRPSPPHLGRLAFREGESVNVSVEVRRAGSAVRLQFTNHTRGYTTQSGEKRRGTLKVSGVSRWTKSAAHSVFIPAQDVMGYAHGGVYFAYRSGDVVIPGHHADLMETIFYRGMARGATPRELRNILQDLEKHFGRRVRVDQKRGKIYIVERSRREIEAPLVAEGVRKLALLWLLVKTRDLQKAFVLFWDEPEAHLHPRWIRVLGQVLVHLAATTQIFIATHSPVLLEELDLRVSELGENAPLCRFYVLDRHEQTEVIQVYAAERLEDLDPDPLYDALWGLYQEQVARELSQ